MEPPGRREIDAAHPLFDVPRLSMGHEKKDRDSRRLFEETGRVVKASFNPELDPLLYFRGRYRRLHFD